MATVSMTGEIFAGRYRLERKLGSGGMADVWLAEDQELGRRVAVKILHERYANDEQFVERFRREATHAAGLSHQNIVSIFDRGSADGSYFIVMEYVEGRTLKELLITRGPCPVPVAISYARQVLAALRYAHRNGIIHRDIKPHNVIVDREGRIKVADFGIARAGTTSQMTEAGSIIGTAQYLSPEQARGAPVDESSDLYSTGIVLYELLTGKVPFTGESAVEIAMKHLSQVPDPPSTIRREIPHDVDLVVLRALAKDPADRYRSATEMDRDLELVARGEAVGRETADAATIVLSGAHDATALTQASRRPLPASGDERYRTYDTPVSRGRSIWPWLIAIGVALALAAGGYFLYQKVQDRISQSEPIPVSQYTGLLLAHAEPLVRSDGFEPQVQREPDPDAAPGYVFQQEPSPGTKLGRGSIVVLHVSTGKPKATVPGVVGKSSTDAVAALVGAGLKANPQNVPSDQPAGTVVAQDPKAGTVIVQGSTVRMNVSTGPKQVFLPSVVGLQYDQASAQLQAAGFAVRRTDVDSDQPSGQVVDQTPSGNQQVADHSSVVLQVSKGPTTATVPDVLNQDSTTAQTTLAEANFKVKIVYSDTSDPTQDNHVISQDPPGNTQAKPNSKVTITVGRYVAPPPADTTTNTTPTQ
jgi:beta-lactam-binding protein with PASTA domain/predicted Ser/Thr protein kinase